MTERDNWTVRADDEWLRTMVWYFGLGMFGFGAIAGGAIALTVFG